MTVTERGRKPGLLLAVLTVGLVVTAIASGALTPTPVKKTTRNEASPAASEDWFVWSKSRQNETSPLDLFAEHAGERAFRVNPRNTQAYAGGIDGTTLIYQLIRGALAERSDLRLFDLATKKQQPIPGGINTKSWECCATISGGWILFSRGRAYSSNRQLILLRNLVTGEQRVLDTLRNRNGVLSAGQINGSFAVWARCNPYPTCQVFRYDLAAASATALPVAPGKIPYSPSVNQYGTAYYLQSKKGCGKSVELVKQRLTGLAEILTTLPTGRDGDVTYATTLLPKPPSEVTTTRVYYDVTTCRNQKWDIYRVDDSERLPPPPS